MPPQDCRGKIGAILTVYNAMGSRHSTSRRNIWCLSKVFPNRLLFWQMCNTEEKGLIR